MVSRTGMGLPGVERYEVKWAGVERLSGLGSRIEMGREGEW